MTSFQRKLSNPLTRIVQITKSLTILDNVAAHTNENEEDEENQQIVQAQAISFEMEPGIYQAGELVEIFNNIMKKMNGTTNTISDESSRSSEHAFPLNDLHPTSKYRSTIDWEHIAGREDN